MVLITGTAVVAIIWQGAVRVVGSKLAKELVKAGAKHLTKKNFKKTYDFFKGDKKIKYFIINTLHLYNVASKKTL